MNPFQKAAARLFNIRPTVVEKEVVRTVPAQTQTKTYKVVNATGERGAYLSTPPRLLGQLWSSYMSADGDLVQDIKVVRDLGRQLSKQNAHAAHYLDLVSTNVVGSEGIVLQARNILRTGKPNAKVNAKIESLWAEWGRACTLNGKMSWLDVQDYCARAIARDGEVFVIYHTGRQVGNRSGIALEIRDADSLDHLKNRDGDPERGVNAIKLGVEVDALDRPVAYHFYDNTNLSAYSPVIQRTIRIDAKHVRHLYRHNASAAQSRGISWLHPVLTTMHRYGEYITAELESAYLVAAKTLFFESTDAPNTFADTDGGINPGGAATNQYGGPTNSPYFNPREFIEVAPGTPTVLPPGLKVHELATTHPGITFAPFTSRMLQEMAVGLNVSYASLTGDLGAANNASAREGQQRERDYWKKVQTWFQNQLCQDVFDRWLAMALLTPGALDLPSKSPSDYNTVQWQPRGYSGNDPYKDAKSYADLIQSGIKSRTQIITELGGDVDAVFADLAREASEAERLGINIDGTENAQEIMTGTEHQPTNQDASDLNADAEVPTEGQ